MLPVEIIEQIVESLAGDTASLVACHTFAGRALLGPARSLLFRTIRLSSPSGSSGLQRLLTESPDLIFLVTCLEISLDATKSEEIEPLLSSFCGPPDKDGRYHGTGPLRTVALINVDCFSVPTSDRPSSPFVFLSHHYYDARCPKFLSFPLLRLFLSKSS